VYKRDGEEVRDKEKGDKVGLSKDLSLQNELKDGDPRLKLIQGTFSTNGSTLAKVAREDLDRIGANFRRGERLFVARRAGAGERKAIPLAGKRALQAYRYLRRQCPWIPQESYVLTGDVIQNRALDSDGAGSRSISITVIRPR